MAALRVLGRRDLEALHADSERALVIGLDQQVDVVVLDAQLHDAEVLAARRRQRGLADGLVDTTAAKLSDRCNHAQRDMHRIAGVQERPLLVRRARPLALRRTTGAAALAAALLRRLEQTELHDFRLACACSGGAATTRHDAMPIIAYSVFQLNSTN